MRRSARETASQSSSDRGHVRRSRVAPTRDGTLAQPSAKRKHGCPLARLDGGTGGVGDARGGGDAWDVRDTWCMTSSKSARVCIEWTARVVFEMCCVHNPRSAAERNSYPSWMTCQPQWMGLSFGKGAWPRPARALSARRAGRNEGAPRARTTSPHHEGARGVRAVAEGHGRRQRARGVQGEQRSRMPSLRP